MCVCRKSARVWLKCSKEADVQQAQYLLLQWTPLNRITDNRISFFEESNVLPGTKSFPIPAVLKCSASENQIVLPEKIR